MKSIDSIERSAYGKRKDLVFENEKIKCNNIIKKKKKKIQKRLTFIMLQKKT